MLAQETVLEKLREWMEELFEIAPETPTLARVTDIKN